MARFEVLDLVDTPIGRLILRRRELVSAPGTIVTEVTIDGGLLMSSHYCESERALARQALARHPGDGLRLLVGGLGLGLTAAEALTCERVAAVEVVERLPEVIGWREAGHLDATLPPDPRLSIRQGDVYADLLGPPTGPPYDLLLIDVDHSPVDRLDAPASAPFYTPEGLRQVRRHLAPGGVLAVWSTDDDDDFAAALTEVLSDVRRDAIVWWNGMVDTEVSEWLFLATAGPTD